MQNLFEELVETVTATIEMEGKINIVYVYGASSVSNMFVPYECDFNNCIYIAGENAVLSLDNIDGMEISFDTDEFQIVIGDERIFISCL